MASNARVERQLGSTYTEDGDRGVVASNVENAKTKFQEYINVINSEFEDFKNSISKYGAAFFGEQTDAIRQYVNGIMDASAGILAVLNDFAPKLDEAIAAYRSQDSTVASGLSDL